MSPRKHQGRKIKGQGVGPQQLANPFVTSSTRGLSQTTKAPSARPCPAWPLALWAFLHLPCGAGGQDLLQARAGATWIWPGCKVQHRGYSP